MQVKRWCKVMAAVMTILALAILIPTAGQTASNEQVVTVYKTPT